MNRFVRQLLSEIVALYRWWVSELEDIGRAALTRLAPNSLSDATIVLTPEAATLSKNERHGVVRRLSFSIGKDGEWRLDQASGDRLQEIRACRVKVALAPEDILTHQIELPLRAERELEQAVNLHLERILPVNRDSLAINYRVIERNRDFGRIVVRVLVAHRRRVEGVQETIRQLGLKPVSIGVLEADGRITGNFLSSQSERIGLAWMPFHQGLLASIGALLAILIALTASQWSYERWVVQRELAELGPDAAAAEELKRALDERNADFLELAGVMNQPDGVDGLAALIESQPAGTWVQLLEIRSPLHGNTEFRWTMHTGDASETIEALTRSPILQNVAMVSTLSGNGTEQDRVEMTAMLDWNAGQTATDNSKGPTQ